MQSQAPCDRRAPERRTLLAAPWIWLALAVVIGLGTATLAQAAGEASPHSLPSDGGNCFSCHTANQLTGVFGDGSTMSLSISAADFKRSVHAKAGLGCTACHAAEAVYPHSATAQVSCATCHEAGQTNAQPLEVELAYESRRAMILDLNANCQTCHVEQFKENEHSAHTRVLRSGNDDAPVCVDCHSSHDISPERTARANVAKTCAECHWAVYTTYRSSVHGAALEKEANADVPTCVACHGVHAVRGPHDFSYRNDSIVLCGTCHNHKPLMDQYGLSTEVFSTYLNDFHGRTVDLFRQQGRGISSEKAVCFDCHGIHNIRSPEDPQSLAHAQNILAACQKCHPDATERFPTAWLGHYAPSAEKTPLLYAVALFYRMLIGGTVGGFVFYIALDARKRRSDKRQLIVEALTDEDHADTGALR